MQRSKFGVAAILNQILFGFVGRPNPFHKRVGVVFVFTEVSAEPALTFMNVQHR
jgi:hypothetical protein